MRRIASRTLLFVAAVAGCLALIAQPESNPKPLFEAASIKPAAPAPTGNSTLNTDPGRMMATNWTLRQYIMIAYGIKTDALLAGGPKWIDFDAYDIVATIEAPAKPLDQRANTQRMLLALQALLVDRFHLAFHKEMKPGSGFALTAARNGPRLKAAPPDARNSNHTRNGIFTADAATMRIFAEQLTFILGSEVEDRTGIDGVYAIRLEWSPNAGRANSGAPPGLTIFEALQEQLGLKLSSTKIEQEVFVIDRAEKPAPN